MATGQRRFHIIAVLLPLLASSEVAAQGPTINSGGVGVPELLRNESSLGAMPGSGGEMSGAAPGSQRSYLGGAPGALTPKVPPSVSYPGGQPNQFLGGLGVSSVPQLPPASLPLFGVLSLPGEDDLGPANGLTLDDAMQRLLETNLDLRSRYLEIPQARADILTASLYANPLLFFDSQLIPYGSYSLQRPGGQTQYDVNISHPVDVTGKRRARIRTATAAKNVVEAQYQDSVRLEIANLYEAYLGALLAREAVRFAKSALEGLDQILKIIKDQQEIGKLVSPSDIDSVQIQRELAEASVVDAEKTYESAKLRLGSLFNLPAAEAVHLELRGTFKVEAPPPPLGEELVGMALQCRPDVQAYRLGVTLSQASLKLAHANRMADIYIFYQPFTFQDNSYMVNKQNATSWALGATIPLPVYNRNQGNIQRSQVNIQQSILELKAQELRAVTEVKQAENEYLVARANVERMERTIRPAADRVLSAARVRWRSGEKDLLFYLSAVRDYNAFVRQYLSAWLRFRRSMLRINTVVGQRLLP